MQVTIESDIKHCNGYYVLYYNFSDNPYLLEYKTRDYYKALNKKNVYDNLISKYFNKKINKLSFTEFKTIKK